MTDHLVASADQGPLVTFVLFAFNQEAFVHEAIEAAFAQTYSPLEIILSDDCSSDRTFEIMQEMAAAYRGPHKVIARRNALNLGTAQHAQSAFDASSGDLFVVAAGDDISDPGRTAKLAETWIALGKPPGLLHSGWLSFNDSDPARTRHNEAKKPQRSGSLLENYAKGIRFPAAAPTCAYTREVFERFAPLHGGSIIEDAPLFLRSALVGEFHAINEPLLRARTHESNTGTAYKLSRARSWNRFLQSKMVAFRQMQCDLTDWTGDMDARLKKRIEKRILSVIRSASTLAVPETYPLNAAQKFTLFVRISTAAAVAFPLRVRVFFALSFFGFKWHENIRRTLKGL